MLTLVTYAYAIGISDDRAAAALSAVEPDLRELCHGKVPSAGTIRRFRNHNRNVIVTCLGKLLRHVWCHQNPPGPALRPLPIVEILCEARARVQRPPSHITSNAAVGPANLIFQGDKTTHARV